RTIPLPLAAPLPPTREPAGRPAVFRKDHIVRAYFTTDVATTRALFRDGFTDLYQLCEVEGVIFADRPLGANDGLDGGVVLCVALPEDAWREYDGVEDGDGPGYRYAILPTDVLNKLGKPMIYDHEYAGSSRAGLLRAALAWQEMASQTADDEQAES